jgi:hypothetical protein
MDAPPSNYSLWQWSSEGAPTRARLDAWRDLVSRKLVRSTSNRLAISRFAQFAAARFAGIEVC